MGCLKCGRDLEEDQIFCATCLESMEKYPVKPGTPVSLPKPREEPPARKSSRSKLPPPPEEQVKRLRRRCHWLTALVALLLIGYVAFGLVFLRLTQESKKPAPGQNYSTMETTSETGAEASTAG